MAFDLSSLFWIFFAIMVLQPLFMGRWYTLRRTQAIRAIERSHGSRVITMIHRQEKRSLFGFAVTRHIDLEAAQTIIAAIKETPEDMPIDLVIHTPGRPRAGSNADRACGGSPQGKSNRLCSCLCNVRRNIDCTRR